VIDFPLLEFNEELNRWHAMHHPFTSPKPEDIELIDSNPGAVRANAYDMVINGVEIGGGSIRILINNYNHACLICLFHERRSTGTFGF